MCGVMLCGVVCVSSKSSNKRSKSKSVQVNLEVCAMSLGNHIVISSNSF